MTGIDSGGFQAGGGGFHAGGGGIGAGVSIEGHKVGSGWNGNNDNVEGSGEAGVSVDGYGDGIDVNSMNDNIDGNAGVGWQAGLDQGGYGPGVSVEDCSDEIDGDGIDGDGFDGDGFDGDGIDGNGFDGDGIIDNIDGNAGVGWTAGSEYGGRQNADSYGPGVSVDGYGDGFGVTGVGDIVGSNAGVLVDGPGPGPGPGPGFGVNGAGDNVNGNAGAAIGGGVAAQPPLTLLPNPGVGASCTVLGGPARLLFLPPPAINATSPDQASVTPAPPGGDLAPKDQPITAWANTFNPDYCYLSFNTLYATQSGTTIGPTFSNALIPFKTSEISTVCAAQPTATDGGRASATPFNFTGLSGGDTGCYHIAAPPSIGDFIPSWDNAHYWNVTFKQPQVILPEGAADNQPDDGPVGAAPAYSPPAGTAHPTIVTEAYPKNYTCATETAPPGSSAASFGQSTATRLGLASPTITGSTTSPFRSLGSNVSTSSVDAYTGAALTTASTSRLGLLVGMIALLLALI